jgi:hypothetical protein
MWTAVAILTAVGLAPGQAGQLTLTHVRSTHGVLGPARADDKLLPGDSLVVCFDIEGVTADEDGKVEYSTAIEVTNAAGKVIYKQEPRKLEAINSLGGNSVPAYARLDIGLDQQPGDYTFKVAVTDRASGRTQTLARNVTLLPRDFGLIRLTTSSDREGLTPAPALGAGQPLWVNFGAVGFTREESGRQPNVAFEIRVLDEAGKPTTARPARSVVNKDVPEKALGLPMHFLLSLNRPGKFTVELLATDQVSKKKAKLSFPVTVLPAR